VHALICYKQKCKVVSLNLAHPVDFKFGTRLFIANAVRAHK